MAAAKSRQVRKIELMRDLLEERLSGSKSGTAHFSYTDLKNPLLDGAIGIKDLLQTIVEYSGGQITYSIEEQPMSVPHYPSGTSDTNAGKRVDVGPLMLTGVTVLVKEPQQLRKVMERVITKAIRKKFDAKKIQSIEIISDDGDLKATVIVNEDVNNSFRVRKDKKRWGVLIEVAKEGSAYSDDAQSIADYFNTAKACPLYSNSHYALSEILIVDDTTLRPATGVKIDMKTNKTIKQRRNKNT